MTQQTINVGAAPNDGTGDPARTSFQKVNSNFTELYATTTGITSATTGQVLYANGGVAAGAAGLTYTLATGNVSVAAPVSGAALTSYGTILFGAANPALVFNIGGAQIYSTLANTLQFSSDGTPTERMRIGAAGNVTINAPSSGEALAVAGLAGTGVDVTAADLPRVAVRSTGTAVTMSMRAYGVGPYGIIGTQTNHGIQIRTNDVSRIESSATGNVTINAPSSGTALTVAGQVKVTPASGQAVIDGVYAGTATGSNLGALRFYGTGGGVTGEVDVTGVLETGSLVNSACLFYTALSGSLTEKMRLDSSGNLGIGVTPSAWAAPGAGKVVQINGSTGFLAFNGINGNITTNTYFDGTHYRYIGTGAATMFQVTNGAFAWGAVASGTAGALTTGGVSGADFATNAMTLDAGGGLGISTASPTATYAAKFAIESNLNVANGIVVKDTGTTYGTSIYYAQFLNSAAGFAGSIQHTAAGTVSFATSSDRRLKKNIVDAPSAMSNVSALRVRSFDFKDDEYHVTYGLIAQEAHIYAPNAVSAGDDGEEITDIEQTWQIDYSKFVPMLVKAMQEQQALIESLTTRLAALEAK